MNEKKGMDLPWSQPSLTTNRQSTSLSQACSKRKGCIGEQWILSSRSSKQIGEWTLALEWIV